MKCIILAGGKGNSMWPLSRENYPKQFMEVKEGRSLLQEMVAKNIPFCDEFIISSNLNYKFIIESQMKAFQGLRYRCFLEEDAKKTAPAVAMICMGLNPSELVFVLSADQIIEGENYKDTVIRAQNMAREGALVTFGMQPDSPNNGYGYIQYDGEKVLAFKEKPDVETASRYIRSGDYLWNSGNFLFRSGDFLHELKLHAPQIYSSCENAEKKINYGRQMILLDKKSMAPVPAMSIEHAVFEKSDNVRVIKSGFQWFDIGDLEKLSDYTKSGVGKNVIEEKCGNVTVINRSKEQLVVANGLEDTIIVNTDDALYISKKGQSGNIKEIMRKNHDQYSRFFENHSTFYYEWGTQQVLEDDSFFKVKKVVVFPGKTHHLHKHGMRSEQWTVVKGVASITLGKECRDYRAKETVYVPVGVEHAVSNNTDSEVIIIEISIGQKLVDEDSIKSETMPRRYIQDAGFVKLEPAFKDYLWGGTKLRDIYHKKCDYDVIAESWELSSHKDGQSIIAEGPYKGMLFGEYIKGIGEEGLGWKCQAFERFPILIKFIDAKNPLSIQVHPNDEYALSRENEYGKNEMWYIMDCDPGASIYYGVNRDISKEELQQRVKDNTVLEVLNKVEVHKGDTFFVKAGTIHAIGAGILICEIQQNSNCTYRLYDYDRRDKFGNPRELHLEKATDVSTLEVLHNKAVNVADRITTGNGFEIELLGSCKYFESSKYTVGKEVTLDIDETSFNSILIIDGEGHISCDKKVLSFKPADSFFVPAGRKKIQISGKCTFIRTHV
ncbi:mannose-1-phosphate guanylyltransferase/mannose-6-phosphate isomerase [Catenibacillus scindens]|uniref:Phosphohexomutase n=1 Tax=Catenibacillus scindens TaxID=673271 RepID=A0A7W8H8I0_9FIRM|nr:type I phosphomannose isomerase catalytic subunit [Catenibacillus scindens]MBB5263463.1 mannose-1-phosphate guanylyltransferase/mannose-6-phosphate isomerase [Catenibacillus scindens]